MTLGFLRETTRVEKRSTDYHGGESEPHSLIGPAGGLAPPYTDSMDCIDPLATYHRCNAVAACLAEAQSTWVEGRNKGT